jgi:hypothetical protein
MGEGLSGNVGLNPANISPQVLYPETTVAYDTQARVNIEAGKQQYRSMAAAQQGELNARIGDLRTIKNVVVWDHLRVQLAAAPRDRVRALLRQQKLPSDGGDDMDAVFRAVAADPELQTGKLQVSTSDKPFSVGAELAELLKDGPITDPAVRTKATTTINLLGQYGMYRFAALQDPAQLIQALSLMEDFARVDPGFDPVAAGYAQIIPPVVTARSILNVDDHSKPDLKRDPTSQVGPLLNATETAFGHLASAHTYAATRPHPGDQPAVSM